MVGVPGKYKGCNSCRVRRVKCDNERPFCRKCIDSGRECLGYERETVFIIGTIEDGGRCSSHPPRVIKSKKAKASTSSRSGGEEEDRIIPPQQKHQELQGQELFLDQPLQSAWDDFISLTTREGRKYNVQFITLNTRLQSVVYGGESRGEFTVKSMEEYKVPNLQVYFGGQDFELRSRCLVSLPEGQGGDAYMPSVRSCVFLYEHNYSTPYTNLYSNQPKDFAVENDPVRRAGPEKFQAFPNHHFFVQVYRPNAILSALLNRTPTFLESAEWTSVPWENHSKSILDQLLDIISLLPRILSRADRVITEEVPSLPRRQRAQDLLTNCLNIERQLNAWSSSFSAEMTAAISRQTTAVITPSSSATSMLDYGQLVPSYLMTPPTSTASYPYLSPSSSPFLQGQGQSQHRRSPSNSVSRSRGTPSPIPSASASSPRFQPYPISSPQYKQPRSRRTSPSFPAHPGTGYQYAAGYPFANPPLVFPNPQLALAHILYCTALMQLYQVVERVYWSIFEPLPLGTPLEVQMQMQQMSVDLMSNVNPARYGSKAVRGLAERVGRSLEFALGNGTELGLLAYPLFMVRNFYESLGMGMGMGATTATTGWDGLGVQGMGMGMEMGMNINLNGGMAGMGTVGSMNYSAGFENLNLMGMAVASNTVAVGLDGTTMQQQPQSVPPDGKLEVIWCDQFREKLKARGAEISNSIMGQGKKWKEVAAFGY